jgi:hypothetical protein
VVAGRPRQGESAEAHRVDRCARREQRCVVGRLVADRVGVEVAACRSNLLQKLGRVAAEDVGLGRRGALDEREALVQDDDSLLRLRVRARRVEIRERAVAYELDSPTA